MLDLKVSCHGDHIWKTCYFQLHLDSNTLKYSFNDDMNHRDVRCLNFNEIHNVAALMTSELDHDHYYFVIHYKGHGSPLMLRTTSSDERSSWVDSIDQELQINLCENMSYMTPTSATTSQSCEYPPLSVTLRPHYQPLDPSTRLYNNEAPAAGKFHFDDITLENMPYIQQLAATNPSQFQLFILVKMQKMLLEIQTERQSLAHGQQLHSNPSSTENCSPEHFQQSDPHGNDSAASLTAKPEDYKGIVYSTLSFDYETVKEENMKLVLENLLVDTKKVTDKMLVTDDYSESYYPRPQWAKADQDGHRFD